MGCSTVNILIVKEHTINSYRNKMCKSCNFYWIQGNRIIYKKIITFSYNVFEYLNLILITTLSGKIYGAKMIYYVAYMVKS